MRRPTAPQALLILAGLLAPVFGGYVSSDQTRLDPSAFLGDLGAGQAPVLQHALLALPVFAALVCLLVGRRVQQIPHPYVAMALVFFVGGLAPAVAASSYRAVSVNVWVEWAAYAVAFLACVSGLGRRVGPLALLGAVFAGTAWIAREGALEYLDMRRIDPSWRVFCNWSNPNAAAEMLVLGFFCALGLPSLKERSANLLLGLGVAVGGGLVLGALLLTGSKGGAILALPTGLVVFGLVGGRRHPAMFALAVVVLGLTAVGFLKSLPLLGIGAAAAFVAAALWPQKAALGRMGAAFAFAAMMLLFFSSTTPGAVKTTSASRMSAAADTQDQSSTFRLNLWKSAASLAKERPITGWGLGSYRFESARPGLATATVFAHNSYLQLAAEAGLGALTLFFAFLALWARRALRGSSRLPDAQRLPFAAAVGGVAAILAHCLVDSDLSYFGLGLVFALVLGAATLLAADAVAPEFVPRSSRWVAAGGLVGLWLLFGYLGWGDLAKSEARFAQRRGGGVAAIEGLAGWDGDAAYLWSLAQPEPVEALKRAFAMQPTPKIARRLALYQAQRGEYASAEDSLNRAFYHDPNNLPALYQLIGIRQGAGDAEGAREAARRLLAVEEKPYFKIRSLDQLVPTETYLARVFLAEGEKDPVRKAALLADAARGLRRYAERTVPEVLRAAKADPPQEFAGETLEAARAKTARGAEAARGAALLYRAQGDGKTAGEMDEAAGILAKAVPE